jgi:hypothetical protein
VRIREASYEHVRIDVRQHQGFQSPESRRSGMFASNMQT